MCTQVRWVTKPRYNDILWKKFPLSYFRKPFLCLLYIYATEPFRYAYSCTHSEHGGMCVVTTNKWFSRGILNKYTLFPVSLNSPSVLLSSVNTSIKGHVKKKTSDQVCTNVRLVLVKWVNNFMQAQLNRNQDFVLPVLDSSRTNPERQLPVPLDKGNGGSEDETGRLRAGSLHVIPG